MRHSAWRDLRHASVEELRDSRRDRNCDITSVGLAGFEPATSATQTRRASQAALQPVPTQSSVPGCRVASRTVDRPNLGNLAEYR
jgi:hypothetical protein